VAKAIDFVFAARPMLLFPIWSIYLITYRYADFGRSFDTGSALAVAGVGLLGMGAYYVNQIYDYQSDLINNKIGFMQQGFMKRGDLLSAHIVVSAVALLLGFMACPATGFFFSLLYLVGIFYSVPPFSLKNRPVLGMLSNGFALGVILPLSVPGFLRLSPESVISIASYFFLTVSAVYLLTIIPDREGDKRSGKLTLAILLPDRTLILLAFGMTLLSTLNALASGYIHLAALGVVSAGSFLIAAIVPRESIILFACKFPILLTIILAGYYYPWYLIFAVVITILTRLYYQKRFGICYPRLT
jgi:4-hydroxybenzoate polyprenyltransferase